MPSESGPGGTVRRLHPVSPLFRVGSAARSLLLPGLFVIVASRRGGSWEIWLMPIFVLAVIGTLAQYFTYRYRLEGDEMVIREGIFFRNERHVPYSRIQNIDLVQNPVHRLFGVAEVRVETAAGGKPEAVMRVLSLDAVEQMRSSVFRDGGASSGKTAPGDVTAVDPTEQVLHAMTPKDVLLFGIISNKGMVVVAAALGLLWQFDPWEELLPSFRQNWNELAERYMPTVPLGNIVTVVALVLVVLPLLVIFMRLLSVVWAFLKFYGFNLRRRGDDLRAEYGLLTRISKTIPRHRIQVLSIRESVLHRWFSRAAVQVETAGGAGDDEGSGSDRLWLAPIVHKTGVATLFKEALPGVDPDDLPWQGVSPRARRRLLRAALIAVILPTVGLVVGLGPWALLFPVVILAWAVFYSRQWCRHAGFAVVPGAIFYRSGWWVRRVSVARFGKMQVIRLGQSPFDRRHGMASVSIDTAGAGRIGHGLEIPYLDETVATELSERLSDEAERTRFEW